MRVKYGKSRGESCAPGKGELEETLPLLFLSLKTLGLGEYKAFLFYTGGKGTN